MYKKFSKIDNKKIRKIVESELLTTINKNFGPGFAPRRGGKAGLSFLS